MIGRLGCITVHLRLLLDTSCLSVLTLTSTPLPMTPDTFTPLSNNATEAADKINTPSVLVRSDGTPVGTSVELSNGVKLGLVQDIVWGLGLDSYARCVITTIATPIEFKTLQSNTDVRIIPAIGYHPFRYLWDWYAAKASSWLSALHKAPTP